MNVDVKCSVVPIPEITDRHELAPGIYSDRDGDYFVVTQDRAHLHITNDGVLFLSDDDLFNAYAPYARLHEGASITLTLTN